MFRLTASILFVLPSHYLPIASATFPGPDSAHLWPADCWFKRGLPGPEPVHHCLRQGPICLHHPQRRTVCLGYTHPGPYPIREWLLLFEQHPQAYPDPEWPPHCRHLSGRRPHTGHLRGAALCLPFIVEHETSTSKIACPWCLLLLLRMKQRGCSLQECMSAPTHGTALFAW